MFYKVQVVLFMRVVLCMANNIILSFMAWLGNQDLRHVELARLYTNYFPRVLWWSDVH